MEDLGFTSDEIIDIFRILSAVLKLGNINFVPTTNMDGTDGCAISNDYGRFIFSLIFFESGKLNFFQVVGCTD